MNKLLKSRKALSPVIASIILVAVTVAVSIAVAAWMGALTFSFTKNDQFTIASVVFGTTAPTYTYINMTISNTGSSSWTITSPAQINSVTTVPVTAYTSLTCAAGSSITIKLTPATGNPTLSSGNQYSITVLLSDGNKITWVGNAP
ncbi:MAG TPA: archaellin/type IV pilin N-terminal domain-containing protein [Candidatus Bathyarchaeia archaeon]|nr:archaellin/type IV pilin N-terminal domain-containing protein [Candidatus Bathyarchaeia archaeon]